MGCFDRGTFRGEACRRDGAHVVRDAQWTWSECAVQGREPHGRMALLLIVAQQRPVMGALSINLGWSVRETDCRTDCVPPTLTSVGPRLREEYMEARAVEPV